VAITDHIYIYNISKHSRFFALQPLTPATSRNDSNIATIHDDLLRCSKAMGISGTRLRENASVIRQVGQAAQQFLNQAVRLVVPEPSLFTAHRNPCFYSNVSTGNDLDTILLDNLRPEVSKGLQRLRKQYSREALLKMFTHHRSLVCLPYFYIAGFPKSATTSLHEALQRHPQIANPLGKEPHWWTRVSDLSNIASFPQDYAMFHVWTYLSFFKKASEKIEAKSRSNDGDNIIVTYDGSQSLLWDSNFFRRGQDYCAMPAVLSRVQPGAKFVVVMRNPTTRLYSHFIWSFKYHLGDLEEKWPAETRDNISERFHSEVVSVTNRFKDCLKISSLLECASGFKYLTKTASVNRIAHKFYIGLYYVHIRKWLQFFPREQFLFLRMEDMVADFTKAMGQIIDFLGLKQVARGEMEKWLTKANARSGGGGGGASQSAMRNDTKNLLDEVYRPYNKLLAELLEDDRYQWTDQ
jgi:N-acetylgalactosamine 4-sulfate 6-O-sulfotransferase